MTVDGMRFSESATPGDAERSYLAAKEAADKQKSTRVIDAGTVAEIRRLAGSE